MPNSLKSRLKKLEHKGLLSEKDLSRIVVITNNATNGDMIKAMFDVKDVEEMKHCVFVTIYPDYDTRFIKEWWNAPYKENKK